MHASYRAVLFDLDGTLLDTIDDLAESMNATLDAMGLGTHDTFAYKLMIGDGMDKPARRALPKHARDDDRTVAECVRRMNDEYSKRWFIKTTPYKGIPELLDELAKKSMPMAVLSNKPHDFVKLNVQKFFLNWHFASVIGARNGIPIKPDPYSALEIASDLKVPASDFLFLGDSDIDMKTARAARMCPVGVLWGFRDEEELRSSGAEMLLTKPLDLLQYID
ncbi:MAG: HAD family hydrolase [Pseudomonadota bacterium]